MRQEILRMERVSYLEQGVTQLDSFNLSILAGEIMGLLPINNHGLTALLRLLQRNSPLKYGYVYYREEQVNTWRNTKQRGNRIGLIRSESALVEGLTVADNIFVLRPGVKTWVLKPSVLEKQLAPFLESIDIFIPATAYVGDLTPFEKVVVDVLKSVVAGCRLIVLQDISTNICEAELGKIHRLLRHYASQGVSFLYIDFHFEELRQICDKVALMSNGTIVKVLSCKETTPDVFSSYTGEYTGMVRWQGRRAEPGGLKKEPPVFEARDVCDGLINGLSFTAGRGECVVLQSVDSQIQGEMLSALSGETTPKSGEILLCGKKAGLNPAGEIAIIQELPTDSMLFNELSYLDNLCFMLDRRLPGIWHDDKLREGVRREFEGALGAEVFDMRVETLSEARKYELVYNRIALQKPKAVFCVQPFRRADMLLRMHIWRMIKMLLDKGIAVIILAVNLSDSLSLADKLVRIRTDKPDEVYMCGDFSAIPASGPWIAQKTIRQEQERSL
jgi:ribose transport system ATP-binding protein